MNLIKLKIEHPEHDKMVLTNERGDTYTTHSEELGDFLFGLTEFSDAQSKNPTERWISIMDDMPKEQQCVDVYDPTDITDDDGVGMAYYLDELGFCMPSIDEDAEIIVFEGVTHWRPRPEPPKE